ncbi:MAG: YkgJ family cysteine cluster protein [Polyangiales bacterium]
MPRWEEGKLHLDVRGQSRGIAFPVAVGEATPLDLVPMARALSAGLTAASLDWVASEGRTVSCSAGCAACCRPLIPISPIEAVSLLEVVRAMPEPRQSQVRARFAGAVARMEAAGLLEAKAAKGRQALLQKDARGGESPWDNVSRRYHALQIACPFLENEACSIYEQRPMVCREYHVVSPKEYCATLDPRTEAIPWYVRLSEVLAEAGRAIVGGSSASIPLSLALEWAEVHGDAYRATHDGETMAQKLLEEIDAASHDPAQ